MPAISRFYILEKKLPSLPMSVCTTVKVHLDISLWWFILIIFLHFWSALEIKKLLKFNRKLLKIYKHLSLSYLPSTWGFRSVTCTVQYWTLILSSAPRPSIRIWWNFERNLESSRRTIIQTRDWFQGGYFNTHPTWKKYGELRRTKESQHRFSFHKIFSCNSVLNWPNPGPWSTQRPGDWNCFDLWLGSYFLLPY